MPSPSETPSPATDPVVLEHSVRGLVEAALAEDLGAERDDVTTRLVLGGNPAPAAEAVIRAKAPGRLSGVGLAAAVFALVDGSIEVEVVRGDGDPVAPGDVVLSVRGPAPALLLAERTALNFMGRLSGIATRTALFVEAVEGTGAHIVDTRKTTPGWRLLEKAAVRDGGGRNHRMGLHDEVLLKENHFAMAGEAYGEVVRRVRGAAPQAMRVTAEADTLEEARAAADGGADVILLDNMSPATLSGVVAALADHPRRDAFQLEASGGVDLASVAEVAGTGVDRISIGGLTHSAPALDLSQLLGLEPTA